MRQLDTSMSGLYLSASAAVFHVSPDFKALYKYVNPVE